MATTIYLYSDCDVGNGPRRSIPTCCKGFDGTAMGCRIPAGFAVGVFRRVFTIVSVEKKDGSMRICVDYRKLNAPTVRDAYPFPSIQGITHAIAGAKYFTNLDCSRGYLKIEMHTDDFEKTAFTFHRGLFEFVRMPFGFSNSPRTISKNDENSSG